MNLDFKKAATSSKADILSFLDSNEVGGLTLLQIKKRTEEYGENRIKANEVSVFDIFLRQFRSPFIYLLMAASVLSILLGEARDAAYILVFIAVNTFLGFYQEYKSESTAKLLKSFIENKVHVVRDGKTQIILSRELVPGDIVELSPGDIVQGDLRILSSKNFNIDESVLTGESESVLKSTTPLLSEPSQIYKASNIAFSGTTVLTGNAMGIVFATGQQRIVSSIAKLTTEAAHVSSFEKGISSFSRFILKTIGATLILMVVANILVKGSGVNIPELFLFSIALAVSVIPEALPVVTTFSLSKGASRLASKKVIVKRLSSVEDLGSISVLCTDKTGTITQNKMALIDVLLHKKKDLSYWAGMGSGFLGKVDNPHELDSFDEALFVKLSDEDKKKLEGAIKIENLPFDPVRRRTTVIAEKDGERYMVSRGAPENIIEVCSQILEKDKIETWISKQGYLGNRVMAVAYKKVSNSFSLDGGGSEKNMELAGLLAFSDPLKATTIQAVHKAKQLGIQIKILTGDRGEVAGAVGVKIGLIANPQQVITGEQFIAMSEIARGQAVQEYNVFARVTPELKYEIVKLLQLKNEVGFLGEGINDAPALKVANVAIVVQSASDISRETADIILLNKSLLTIIEGIEEGRIVFANTVKYIKSTLSSNFGNFYAVAISSLLIPYLPMLPIQILLVNLLSDFPMISIATDNVDPEELKSPRNYQIREVAISASVLGAVSTVFDFLTFALFFKALPGVLQTNWFMESILTELILIYSIRTKRPFFKAKRASLNIFILTGIAGFLTILLPLTDFGSKNFGFIHPQNSTFVLIGLIVVVYFVCTEIAKVALYRFLANKSLGKGI